MEKIRCRTCGSIGYSASPDTRCTNCGRSNNEVLRMDQSSGREYTAETNRYLQRLVVGNVKPGAYCRD